jgi:hypothetical protein
MLLAAACSTFTEEDGAASVGADSGRRDAARADAAAAAEGGTAEDAPIVPEGLAVTALAGGNGVLEVIALTLRNGPIGPELYVALRNEGDVPACSAAVSVELFDESERSLAAGISGLLTQHFYRLTDGSDTIAACVGPGDVTMAAIPDLPSDLAIEEVATVVYRCPYFGLDVVPIDGVTIERVKRVTRSTSTVYTGMFVNGLGVAVGNPSVTIFPVDRVGRPLGVATSSSTAEIPPAGRWSFETNPVDAPGVDHAAYPAGALAD